jgi:RNA polymerase sigma-70 factor (ECF subfamily)
MEDRGIADWDLIQRIRAGDHQAFERLYKLYYHRLSRFVYRITRRLELIEEVINDTMFVVWRKAETLEPTARASTWIFGIAYKKALKHLQRYQHTFSDVPIEEIEDFIPGDGEAAIQKIETEDWLAIAFESLSPEHRAVLELTYYQDMSYGEIAVVMDCPENTVKTRMFHARKRLRTIMPELAAPKASGGSIP